MKVVIDLIENLRESIGNDGSYKLTAMLLKEDKEDSAKLIYSGEADITGFQWDEAGQKMILRVENGVAGMAAEDLIKHLLIADTKEMMFELYIDIVGAKVTKEVVGFGVNHEEKKYGLFIMA